MSASEALSSRLLPEGSSYSAENRTRRANRARVTRACDRCKKYVRPVLAIDDGASERQASYTDVLQEEDEMHRLAALRLLRRGVGRLHLQLYLLPRKASSNLPCRTIDARRAYPASV